MATRAIRKLAIPVHDPHIECLQTVALILNLYQDIEDTLDMELTDKAKLKVIKRLNGEIGKVANQYLPG